MIQRGAGGKQSNTRLAKNHFIEAFDRLVRDEEFSTTASFDGRKLIPSGIIKRRKGN